MDLKKLLTPHFEPPRLKKARSSARRRVGESMSGRGHNKLLRAQERVKKNYATSEKQPTVDEQLTRLEDDIRRLKIEFDIYFNGASKRPPYDTKGRVDTLMKRVADDRTLSYAQRYRYNSLASRYSTFRDLWRRTMQGREEGRDPASAARASAKEEIRGGAERTSFVCLDAGKDVETIKNLYNSLLDAKRRCGEPTEDFSFPRFHRLIASKAEGLKERLGCNRVRFSVAVESGHVSFRVKGERAKGERELREEE